MLTFDNKCVFVAKSLPGLKNFIRRFGGETNWTELKRILSKYFPEFERESPPMAVGKQSSEEDASPPESPDTQAGFQTKALASPSRSESDKEAMKPDKELEMTTKLVTELIKILNVKRERDNRTECGICHKASFIAYTYHCLICESLKICSSCFENRKSNEKHAITHPVVRYDEGFDGHLFGVYFGDGQLNLARLESAFQNELHHNVKCETCGMEPIKGMRLKCDLCYDFSLCLQCFREKKSSRLHTSKHPVIAIGKTESLEINKNEIILLGDPLGRGSFGTVYRAKYLRQNKIVACKIIRYDTLTQLLGLNPTTLLNSFIRELTAFREVKVRMIYYFQNFILFYK